MGQTVFWLKIGPITTFLDVDRGDRFPPMPPIRRYGPQGRPGPKKFYGGGWGPMYAIVYPDNRLISRRGASPPAPQPTYPPRPLSQPSQPLRIHIFKLYAQFFTRVKTYTVLARCHRLANKVCLLTKLWGARHTHTRKCAHILKNCMHTCRPGGGIC